MASTTQGVILRLGTELDKKSFKNAAAQVETTIKNLKEKLKTVDVTESVVDEFKEAQELLNGRFIDLDFGDVRSDFWAKLFNTNSVEEADAVVSGFSETIKSFADFVGTQNLDLFKSFDSTQIKYLFDELAKLGDQKLFVEIEPDFSNFIKLFEDELLKKKEQIKDKYAVPVEVTPDFTNFDQKLNDAIRERNNSQENNSNEKVGVDVAPKEGESVNGTAQDLEDLTEKLANIISNINTVKRNLSNLKFDSNGINTLIENLNKVNAESLDKVVQALSSIDNLEVESSYKDFTKDIENINALIDPIQNVVAEIKKISTEFGTVQETVRISAIAEEEYLKPLHQALIDLKEYVRQLQTEFGKIYSYLPDSSKLDISKLFKLPKGVDGTEYINLAYGLEELNKSIDGFDVDGFSRIVIDLSGIKPNKVNYSKLIEFANGLSAVKQQLNNIRWDNSEDTYRFIGALDTLLSRSEELANLASVLKSTKGQIINSAVKLNESNSRSQSKIANQAVLDAFDELEKCYDKLIAKKQEYYQTLGKDDDVTKQIKQDMDDISKSIEKATNVLERAKSSKFVTEKFSKQEKSLKDKRDYTNNDYAIEDSVTNNKILDKTKELDAATQELLSAQKELLRAWEEEPSKINEASKSVTDARQKVNGLTEEINNLTNKLHGKLTVDSDLFKSINGANNQIDSIEKQIANYQRIKESVEDIAHGSKEWEHVNSLIFDEANADATQYRNLLDEIVKITRSVNKDGYTKYTVTDKTGSSITINDEGELLSYKDIIFDIKDAWALADKALVLYNQEHDKLDSNSSQKYRKYIDDLLSAHDKFEKYLKSNKDGFDRNGVEFKSLRDDLLDAQSALKGLTAAEKTLSQTSVEKFLSKINKWMGENTKAANIFGAELKALKNAIGSIDSGADLNQLEGEFLKLQNIVGEFNLGGKGIGSRIKDSILNDVAGVFTSYFGINDLIRYGQNAISIINDLDYALVDLSKTADMTSEQLNDFYLSANDSAKQFGVTTEEIINLASSWSRLGYSTAEEATQMAEATAKFAAISPGMTTDQASEGLISIMKAWQGEIKVSDIETVMDKINTLGNKFAEENDDVLDGMQQAASALSAMGTSYTDAFALFTGAQEILQDADKVGNGLKSVAMRIRGYSEDVETGAYVVDESLSTISGDLIELTKIDGKLPEGISIYTEATKNKLNDADKEYKTLVEYLREIAKYWNDFSETQQTQLLNKLFAKTQANVGAALITNWGSVEKALTEMENSAGSADAEMSKVEETITFKLNELKETWTGFIQDFIPRELIVDVISVLTDLSEAITSVLSIGGAREIAIAATVAAIKKIYSVAILGMVNLKKEAVNKKANVSDVIIGGVQSVVNQSGSSVGQSSTVNSVNAATNHLTNIKKIADAQQNLNKGVSVYIPTQNSATIAMGKATSEMANASKEATGLKSKIGSLKESFSGLSLISKIQIAAGVAAIGYGIFNYAKTQYENSIQEIYDAADEAIANYESRKSSDNSTIESINSIKDEYAKLAEGVDANGKSISLSTDQFKRYQELSNQIGDAFPELINGWDDQATAILDCRDNLELLNQEIDNLQYNADEELAGNLSTILEAFQNKMNGTSFLGIFAKEIGLDEQKQALEDLPDQLAHFKEFRSALISNGTVGSNDSLKIMAQKSSVLSYEMANIRSTMETAGLTVNDIFKGNSDATREEINAYFDSVELEIISRLNTLNKEIEEEASSAKEGLAAAFRQYGKQNGISKEDLSMGEELLGNISAESINQIDVSQYTALFENITSLLADDSQISQDVISLFIPSEEMTIGAAKETVERLKAALGEQLKENGISQSLYNLLMDNIPSTDSYTVDTVTNAIDQKVSKGGLFVSGIKPDKYADEINKLKEATSQFTETEGQQFLDWILDQTELFNNADDVVATFKATISDTVLTVAFPSFDVSSFSEVKKNIDSIHTSYISFIEDVNDGKLGKDLARDIDDIRKFKELFNDIDDVDFGDYDSFEGIERVLTSGTASAEEMKAAYDQMLTSYVSASLEASNYSEEIQQQIITQLELAGVTEESATAFVTYLTDMANAQQYAAEQGIDLANAEWDEIASMQGLSEQSENTRLAILQFALAKLSANTNSLITTGDIENVIALCETCAEGSKVLESFNTLKENMLNAETDEEKDKLARETIANSIAEIKKQMGGGGVSNSPKGGSSSKSSSGGGSSSSKSDSDDPYLDEFEKQYKRLGELRDQNEIDEYEYAQYLRGLYTNYFTENEKIIKQKEELAKSQEEINELQAEYNKLEEKRLAAKSARQEKYGTEQWEGNVNLLDRPTYTDGAGQGYETVYGSQIAYGKGMNDEQWVVMYTPILPNGEKLDDQTVREYIDSIIEKAATTQEAMAMDDASNGGKGLFFSVNDTFINGNGVEEGIYWNNLEKAQEYYDQISKARHEAQAEIYDAEGDIVEYQAEIKEELVETTEEVEEQTKVIEKYKDELEKYQNEYLEAMQSIYTKVLNGLSSQIDKQISKLQTAKSAATKVLESQKSAAVSALKKEKEAAVAAIDAQIDALEDEIDAIDDEIDAYQDEIDAINDANEARERELALQQALYDLDKLQGQRTNLVYSESQGMHYEADLSGIRDARESVQDAKDDIEIANIQKKIDLLEKQKELIQDQIDELEEQKEAIEEYYDGLIEETEAYYDELIAQSEAMYDEQINNLENGKSAIQAILDAIEEAELRSLFKDLGIDIDTLIKQIEGGDYSGLDHLVEQWASLTQTMYDGDPQMLQSLKEVLGMDFGNLPDYLEQTAAAFAGIQDADIDIVTDGIDSMRTAFENLNDSEAVKQLLGGHLSESFNNELQNISVGMDQFFQDTDFDDITEKIMSTLDLTDKDGKFITSFKTFGEEATKSLVEGFGSATDTADISAKTAELGESLTDGVMAGTTDDVSQGIMTEKAAEFVGGIHSGGVVGALGDAAVVGSPAESTMPIGESMAEGVAQGMIEALGEGSQTKTLIDQFVQKFVELVQSSFSETDLQSMFMLGEEEGEDGLFGSFTTDLTTFIEELGNLDITPITALVEQFTTLKQTISDVSMAISGGGMSEDSEGGESQGGGGSSGGGKSGSSGGKSGGKSQSSGEGGSLVEALQTLGSTSEEVIGSAEDEEGGSGESEGTGMIGQFKNLKTAVQDVTASIGTDETGEGGESGGGEGGEDGESTTLIGAMNTLSEVALNEETGIPKHIDLWHKMNDSIHEAAESLHEFRSELEELVGVTWECHVFKEYAEGSGSSADGTASKAIGTMTGIGYAYARGKNIGLESDQRALVGEIGYEGLCRNGQFSLIGQQGAQMMDLKKGDIIFSHSQTKNLLKNGKINGRGKVIGAHSYADGTPLNKAFSFGGNDYTSSALEQLSARLTGNVESIDTNIKTMTNDVSTVARSYTTVPTNTMSQSTNVTIGDIHLSGVQNPDGLAKAIKSYLPGKMLQELHK